MRAGAGGRADEGVAMQPVYRSPSSCATATLASWLSMNLPGIYASREMPDFGAFLPLLLTQEGGEGGGEEARIVEIPLSPALSPLVPRGERGNLCRYQYSRGEGRVLGGTSSRAVASAPRELPLKRWERRYPCRHLSKAQSRQGCRRSRQTIWRAVCSALEAGRAVLTTTTTTTTTKERK